MKWPGLDSEVTAYILRDADAAVARRRLDQAVPLLGELSEQKPCKPDENVARDFAELQGELWMPTLRVEADEINHGFAISTHDFRIRFLVAPEPDGALQLECWDRITPTGFGVFLGW